MKKGFTLVELLGVMVVISVLIAVSFPIIINVIRDKKAEATEYETKMIINAAKLYIKDNGSTNCIDISTLVQEKYLNSVKTNKTKVKITTSGSNVTYELANSCN